MELGGLGGLVMLGVLFFVFSSGGKKVQDRVQSCQWCDRTYRYAAGANPRRECECGERLGAPRRQKREEQ